MAQDLVQMGGALQFSCGTTAASAVLRLLYCSAAAAAAVILLLYYRYYCCCCTTVAALRTAVVLLLWCYSCRTVCLEHATATATAELLCRTMAAVLLMP